MQHWFCIKILSSGTCTFFSGFPWSSPIRCLDDYADLLALSSFFPPGILLEDAFWVILDIYDFFCPRCWVFLGLHNHIPWGLGHLGHLRHAFPDFWAGVGAVYHSKGHSDPLLDPMRVSTSMAPSNMESVMAPCDGMLLASSQ